MEGQIRVISRNMEGQESGYLDSYDENSQNIWIYAHILMYAGLRVISAYICVNGFKSSVWKITGVFRDDLANIKSTKIFHGVQRVCKGIGEAINV